MFQKNKEDYFKKRIYKDLGYLGMVLVFSFILYLVLKILNRIPENWNYFYILGLAILLIIISRTIKIWLSK